MIARLSFIAAVAAALLTTMPAHSEPSAPMKTCAGGQDVDREAQIKDRIYLAAMIELKRMGP